MKTAIRLIACMPIVAACAHASNVEIFDNQTAYLSQILTDQPSFSISELFFRGNITTSGIPSALLVVDTSKSFVATTGTSDQTLVATLGQYDGAYGRILLTDGASLEISGNVASNSGAIRIGSSKISQLVFDADSADSRYLIKDNQTGLTVGFTKSTANITNADFSNNSFRGIIVQSYGTVTLENSTFSNNLTGIEINTRGSVTANNTEFSGNTSNAITVNSGILNGENLKFDNNQSSIYGGALYVKKQSGSIVPTVSLTNVEFTNNKTTTTSPTDYSGGGAIYASNGNITITNGIFTGNYTDKLGGAIYSKAISLTLNDVSFTQNVAGQNGGAIYMPAGSLNINVSAGKTSTFSGNTANGVANSINMGPGPLTVTTGSGAVLDMRDPFTLSTASGPQVIKNGSGTWKLGGASGSSYAGSAASMTINEGTLYLYGAGEVSNPTATDASAVVADGSIYLAGITYAFQGSPEVASKFTLGSGATLVAAGTNSISIALGSASTPGTIQLDNNSTIKSGTGNTELLLYAQLVNVGTQSGDKINLEADNGDSLHFRAALRGQGGINKVGQGTVILEGARYLSGPITVSEGTLQVYAASVNDFGGYEVKSGATLDLSSAAQTLSQVFTVGMSQSNAGFIVANVSQDFTTSSLLLDFGSEDFASYSNGTTWDILDGSSSSFVGVSLINGSMTEALAYDAQSQKWFIDLGGDRALTFSDLTGIVGIDASSAVPEPATAAALAGLLVLSFTATRRKHRA